MSEMNRGSSTVSGRKGATAAAVVLAVILSLAIGGGAAWFFLAGAQAKAQEALRLVIAEQQRQSHQALGQLQVEIQTNLEKALEELKKLNYGTSLDQLQEAIDKCDLVLPTLVEEDAAPARSLKDSLVQVKETAQAGDPKVIELVKAIQRGGGPTVKMPPEISSQPQPAKAIPPRGEQQPGGTKAEQGQITTSTTEKAAPAPAPSVQEKGTTSSSEATSPPETTPPAEKEGGPQTITPPPIAP